MNTEVDKLKAALEHSLNYNSRLKKERDAARGENAALRSKLLDATQPDEAYAALVKAAGRGVRSSGASKKADSIISEMFGGRR